MVAGLQHDLEAIEFRQHADQVAGIIDYRCAGNPVFNEFVHRIQHAYVGFEGNERPRHVVFDQNRFL